ncbi:radical SAM protein [Embleya scabrispora]|uniref:radical SAM protein n=1 Tax=Embleya scabrispora TaxID=159449 RepID=UPI001FE05E52|nr:radical SAM protein [Embleya scabrispora]
MTARPISTGDQAASCYFRTTVDHPYRKALIQVCEPCNETCKHCFVSATKRGAYMPLDAVRGRLIPQLAAARVNRGTLTGGEPFMHADLIRITEAFRAAGMGVGVCTNATMVTAEQVARLAELGVHMNVSLDGFSPESHGVFRGRPEGFQETVDTVRAFGEAGILQGLLCTPNNLAQDEEYGQLCTFAKEQGARYVLMNPLGPMGRGASRGSQRLRRPDDHMRHIRDLALPFADDDLDLTLIRFPNDSKPLAGCEAGTIIYVFTDGAWRSAPTWFSPRGRG